MKFRCLAEPAEIIVDAADQEEAQNIACVLIARELTPTRVRVWTDAEFPEWRHADQA